METVILVFFMTIVGLQDGRINQLEEQTQLQDKWIVDLENWNDEQDEALTQQELMDYRMAGEIASAHATNERTNRLQDVADQELRLIINQILKDIENGSE